MADVVTPAVRSRMMSGIRSKDTLQEVRLRKALHAVGFRFRLHRRDLPGTPDITLPKYRAVVFMHGCFWHGHDCHLFKWPSTRPQFWSEKIEANKQRDLKARLGLLDMGWRRLVIWECALKGKRKLDFDDVVTNALAWLISDIDEHEITGRV